MIEPDRLTLASLLKQRGYRTRCVGKGHLGLRYPARAGHGARFTTREVDVKADTVARLAKVPNIRAVKESTGDIKRITEIRMLTDEGITVFCGWEDMAYESFVLGARGWVCVIGNILPKAAVEPYELVVVRRDLAAAWRLYRRMLPILRLLEYVGKTQKILKHALDTMGLAGGHSASPKLPLAPQDAALVDRLVREFHES